MNQFDMAREIAVRSFASRSTLVKLADSEAMEQAHELLHADDPSEQCFCIS